MVRSVLQKVVVKWYFLRLLKETRPLSHEQQVLQLMRDSLTVQEVYVYILYQYNRGTFSILLRELKELHLHRRDTLFCAVVSARTIETNKDHHKNSAFVWIWINKVYKIKTKRNIHKDFEARSTCFCLGGRSNAKWKSSYHSKREVILREFAQVPTFLQLFPVFESNLVSTGCLRSSVRRVEWPQGGDYLVLYHRFRSLCLFYRKEGTERWDCVEVIRTHIDFQTTQFKLNWNECRFYNINLLNSYNLTENKNKWIEQKGEKKNSRIAKRRQLRMICKILFEERLTCCHWINTNIFYTFVDENKMTERKSLTHSCSVKFESLTLSLLHSLVVVGQVTHRHN
jgi:hypothetical protein